MSRDLFLLPKFFFALIGVIFALEKFEETLSFRAQLIDLIVFSHLFN